MTTPIQTTTIESAATSQVLPGTDSAMDFSDIGDALFANVAPSLKQIGAFPAPRVIESESADTYDELSHIAPEQEATFGLFASKETPIEPYELKQKWEGYVLEVGDETFRARLTPLAGESGEHMADIYIAEVDKAERNLVRPGSIFYWSIGYRDLISGRRRESFIRFQHLPYRSERELESARQRGKELLQIFSSE